jgi:hypothetical protein
VVNDEPVLASPYVLDRIVASPLFGSFTSEAYIYMRFLSHLFSGLFLGLFNDTMSTA